MVISIYVFPQTPTRALSLDTAGRLVPSPPDLSPSETNSWLRPVAAVHFSLLYNQLISTTVN